MKNPDWLGAKKRPCLQKAGASGVQSEYDSNGSRSCDDRIIMWAEPSRARTLRTATLFVAHPLADLERLDSTSFDCAVVEEQVAPVSLDEPKTFVRDHFLDRPLRHNRHSSTKKETQPYQRPAAIACNSLQRSSSPANTTIRERKTAREDRFLKRGRWHTPHGVEEEV